MFLLCGCSVMEQKTDWLKGTSGEIVRRLQERENSALDYKRCWSRSMDTCMMMCCWITLCVLFSLCTCVGCRLVEDKVDQTAAELTRRHLEREESAQQIKRCLLG